MVDDHSAAAALLLHYYGAVVPRVPRNLDGRYKVHFPSTGRTLSDFISTYRENHRREGP